MTVRFEHQKLHGHAGLRLRLPPASESGPATTAKEVPLLVRGSGAHLHLSAATLDHEIFELTEAL